MSDPIQFKTFEVHKQNRGTTRIADEEFSGELDQNQVLLKVD